MRYIVFILLLALSTGKVVGQAPLNHKHKSYTDSLNRYYQQASLPVYIYISTSPDKADATQLQSTTSLKEPEPLYLDGHGKHHISHKDMIDKHEVAFDIYADGIAPQTEVSFEQAKRFQANKQLFYGPDLKINLKAKDEMSGIEQTFYVINKAHYQPFNQSILLSQEGSYELAFYSVDNVGNAESAHRHTFVLDATAPVTTLEIKGEQYQKFLPAQTLLHLSAKDSLSGVASIHYRLDDQVEQAYRMPISIHNLSEGEHVLQYYALDQVNNKEVQKEFRFIVDKKPPVVQQEIVGSRYSINGKNYFAGDTQLKLTAHDEASGVKEVYYTLNGSELTLYQEPIDLNLKDLKEVVVRAFAIDKVNNKSKIDNAQVEDQKAVVVGIMDFSGPTLSYHFKGPVFQSRDSIFINNRTQISLVGKDAGSGFNSITYQIGNGESKDYSEQFTLPDNGTYRINFKGYDNLLNESEDTFTLIVDTKGPEIIPTLSIASIGTKQVGDKLMDIYPEHVVMFLAATDLKAGFDRIYYSLNGKPEQEYAGVIRNFEKGKIYELKVRATDKLGNEQEEIFRFAIEDKSGEQARAY